MQTVFQGETGGTLVFDYSSTIAATSGYLQLVAESHYIYYIDGLLSSGQLHIPKDILSALPPDKYIGYPQIVDADNDVWFLNEVDVEIEFIPNSPLAYVTVVPSIIARIDALEDALMASGVGDVDSVNGQTGIVVLDADDVGAVPLTRQITVAGLTYDLSADRNYPVTWSGLTGVPTTVSGLGITDNIAYTDRANTFILGPNLFQAGADENVALAARQHSSGATGNIQEWQNSTGIAWAYVTASGNVGIAGGRLALGDVPTFTPTFAVLPSLSANSVLILKNNTPIATIPNSNVDTRIFSDVVYEASSNMTNSLVNIYAHTTLSGANNYTYAVALQGSIANRTSGTVSNVQGLSFNLNHYGAGTVSSADTIVVAYNTQGPVLGGSTSSVSVIRSDMIVASGRPVTESFGVYSRPLFAAGSTVTTHTVFRGRMNQINATANVTNLYGLWIDKLVGGSTIQRAILTDGGTVQFKTGTANIKGVIVTGFTAQTANLQEWHNVNNVAMAYVTPTGGIVASGHSSIGSNAAVDSDTVLGTGVSYSSPLIISETITTTGAPQLVGITNHVRINPTGTATGSMFGIDSKIRTTPENTQTHGSLLVGIFGEAAHLNARPITNIRGLHYFATNSAGATVTNVQSLYLEAQNTNAGALTNLVGAEINLYSFASATTTNAYGIKIPSLFNSGGTIVNNYGISISNVTGGTTLNYAIHTAGGETRHLTGAAGVKGLVVQGAASQTANLQEWQDVNSRTMGFVNASGGLYASGHSAIGNSSFINGGALLYPAGTFSNVLSLQELKTDLSTATFHNGVVSYMQLDPAANTSAVVYAGDFEVATKAGNTRNLSLLGGLNAAAFHEGTGTITNQYGLFFTSYNRGGGISTNNKGIVAVVYTYSAGSTTTTQTGIEITNGVIAAGTVTTLRGLHYTPSVSATVTNHYGIHLASVTGGSMLNYAILTDGGQTLHKTGAATTKGLVIQGATSQTANLQEWQDVSSNVLGSVSASGTAFHRVRDGLTSTAVPALILGHESTGTVADSFGTKLMIQGESNGASDKNMADITATWATAANASRKARVVINVYDSSDVAREVMRGESDGSSTAMFSFLGASASARATITGSRGGNAALAALLTELATKGLIIDGTTV